MSKEQIIADAMAAFQAAEQGVVSDVYDKSFAEGVASVPPADAGEQTKIDAAKAAQQAADQIIIDGLNAQISKDAQDLSDAQAKAVSDLAAIQSSLDSMTAKELAEEQVVQGLKDAVAAFQAVLSGLSPQA